MQIQVAAEQETMVSGAVFQVTSDLHGSTLDFCKRHASSSQVHWNIKKILGKNTNFPIQLVNIPVWTNVLSDGFSND